MEEKSNKFLMSIKNKLFQQTVIAVLCFIVGLLFCVIPLQALSFIRTVALVCFLGVGFFATIVYCVAPNGLHDMKWLIIGIVCIVVGLLFVYIELIFIIALSLYMIFGGVQNIWSGIKEYKETKNKKLFFEIVFGILIALTGIACLVLFNTSVAQKIVMIIYGVLFIVKAIFDLTLIYALKTEVKSISNLIHIEKQTVSQVIDNPEQLEFKKSTTNNTENTVNENTSNDTDDEDHLTKE